MRSTPSLDALRMSLLAAAGLGAFACTSSPRNTGGHGGAGAATSAASTTNTASTTSSSSGHAGGAGGHGGAGAAGGGGASSSATTGGTGGADPVCAGAMPLRANNNAPSGLWQCPDQTIHRTAVVTCDPTIPLTACTGTESVVTCQSDADCTAGPHGKCLSDPMLGDNGVVTSCNCVYACASDAECGAGQACICGGALPIDQTWSLCVPETCASAADCPSGECGVSMYYNGCAWDIELSCRSPDDVCRTNASCADAGGLHENCVVFQGSAWQCKGWTCVSGRPLLVDGAPRVAAAAARDGWGAELAPDLAGLGAAARAELAERWLAAAAMEHASVASFARFTLELCAIGAPAALVAEAQRAGLDEVEHARLCYGLASAYAGRALGPGPLDLGPLRVATDRREVIRALVAEACVSETLSVAEALALADGASDPVVGGVHRRLAADEQRHAELAFRTLAWLLDGAGEATRGFASRCFDEAIAAAGRDGSGLAAVRRQALREVVAPCAAALCGTAPAAEGHASA